MKATTLALLTVPLALGGLGLAAAAVITDQPRDEAVPAPTPPALGVTSDSADDEHAIEGKRPFLTVHQAPEPLVFHPGIVIGVHGPLHEVAPESAPVIPDVEGPVVPVPPAPARAGTGTGTDAQDDSPSSRPPAKAPPQHSLPSPADAMAATDVRGNGNRGRPENAGETGRPDHADTQGPPDHADTQGPPDHADTQGPPDHAGRTGPSADNGRESAPISPLVVTPEQSTPADAARPTVVATGDADEPAASPR
ncbi:hypothetical protein [Dietzia sp. 179-F 9C3 NHS]|uniref:hypothetical protein n=1 Tax=Dietzia sp. 179-F 9C3 NHS TaxID=3374295 RepID=UPI00387A1132